MGSEKMEYEHCDLELLADVFYRALEEKKSIDGKNIDYYIKKAADYLLTAELHIRKLERELAICKNNEKLYLPEAQPQQKD